MLIQTKYLSYILTIFFVSTAIETILIILIVYGFAGNVHKVSIVSLLKLNQIVRNYKFEGFQQNYMHRFLASCQILKIKFGLSNFIVLKK